MKVLPVYKKPLEPALRVALFYLLFGGLWILLSDRLVAMFVNHPEEITRLQTYKGWAFIVASALVIFLLLRRELKLRRIVEEQARESEEYFRLLFENNHDVMLVIDPLTGAIRNANRAAEKFYNYPLSTLRRMNMADISLLSRDEFQKEWMRAGGAQANPYIFSHRLASGEIRTVEAYLTPITRGSETLIFSIVHDVTERKRLEMLMAGETQMLDMITRGESLPAILDTLARNIERIAEGMLCTILLLDSDGIHMRHGAAPSMPESYTRAIDGLSIGPCVGSCGTAAYRKEAVFVEDIASDPLWAEYREVALAHGLRACWSIPFLSNRGEVLGTFAAYYREPRSPAGQDIYLVERAARIAGIAIERKRAEEELRLSHNRLKELSRQLIEAQEIERRTIGRELHDQFGQMLTALKLTLETAAQLPPQIAQTKLAQALELTNDLLTRTSRLSLDLRPPMLDDFGLIPALLWHINRFEEQSGIRVNFTHTDIQKQRFAPEIEITAYRVIQEALTNTARHAGANRIRLEVRAGSGELTIEIEDDGKGFDPQQALAKRRGLNSMRERVALAGGSFQIQSRPGDGSRLFIRLPLKEAVS